MSMNIYIYAEREIFFKNKKGETQTGTQKRGFRAIQTPSRITRAILRSADPKQVYIDWVLSMAVDSEIYIYAEDDIFEERGPIGTTIINSWKEHVMEFEEWIKNVEEQGYEVKYEGL